MEKELGSRPKAQRWREGGVSGVWWVLLYQKRIPQGQS